MNVLKGKWTTGGTLAAGAALLALAGALDYATGPRISVLPLYLLAVCVVSWFGGRVPGCVAAVGCALTWLCSKMADGELDAQHLSPYWNAVAGMVVLWVAALLVVARRDLGRKIEEMVEEKTLALTAEVSERKRAEQAVHRLAAQLSVAEEVQRRQLAHDIHDTLGQTLAVVKMNLEATLERANPQNFERLRESLLLIENMIHQTRTMTFELYPAMLDDLGLVATVRRYSEQFQRQTGVQATVSESGEGRSLPVHTANYLFRAIKELMNNANKHGRAREILITVHWREHGLRVVVDDDGRGFDVSRLLSSTQDQGLGLAGIRERLMSLGGEAAIDSASGKGTRVIMELPLEAGVDVDVAEEVSP